MAKKVGSDEGPKLVSPGATAPDTNAIVTEGSFLSAVKEITAATAKVTQANDARKQIRKKWKASGIALGPLDAMVRMAEWSRGEVRDHFTIEKNYAMWLGLPVEGRQSDAFKGLEDEEIQAREWNAVGRTYNRTGKPGRPPEECPEEFHQAFMRGYNEEDEAAWGESEEQDKVEELTASTDVFDVTAFPDDVADWSDDQEAAFQKWFEGLAAKEIVHLEHPGVIAAFRAAAAIEQAEGGDRAADCPVLGEDETPDEKRNRVFNEGVQAHRDKADRRSNPYSGQDGGIWLDGWDHSLSKEMAEQQAKAPPKKGGKDAAVH